MPTPTPLNLDPNLDLNPGHDLRRLRSRSRSRSRSRVRKPLLFEWFGGANHNSFRCPAFTTRIGPRINSALLRWLAISVGVILPLALATVCGAQTPHQIGYEQIYAFLGGPSDGEYLFDSVIEGSDGRLYGTT